MGFSTMTPGNPSPDRPAPARNGAADLELPALRWLHRAGAEDELLTELGRRLHLRRRRRIAVTASLAALVVCAGVWWQAVAWRAGEVSASAPYAAKVALPERRLLPDGSAVELKEGAQIDVDYGGPFRRVVLRKGEAHFEVVKDPRGFVVEAAGVSVRAVGTAFSVQLGSAQVEVLVTEGRVRVAPALGTTSVAKAGDATPPAASASDLSEFTVAQPLVDAGHRAIVSLADEHPKVDPVTEDEAAEALSWRIPNLELSRTPLPEVIRLMNRHASPRQKLRFVIAGAELNDVRLSGFLRIDNTDGLVRLLENDFGIQSERAGDTITLRKAAR
jgi:transmembrane sensor